MKTFIAQWREAAAKRALYRLSLIHIYLTFIAKKSVTVDEVNAIVRDAAAGYMGMVMAYDPEPKVSIDFNHTPYSSIFAPDQTKVVGLSLIHI